MFKSAKAWAGKNVVGKLFGGSEKSLDTSSLAGGLIPGADKPSQIDLPVYPPYAKGIAASNAPDALGTQDKLIRAIFNNLGLSAEEWKLLVVPVLTRYAEFVHLLPASEAHHHRGAGGLLRHGLEVSYWAATKADGMRFSHALTPKQRRLEPRAWRFAAFICGLLHDLGKPLVDIRVTDREGVKTWTPHEPLTRWLEKNELLRYYVHWRPDRVHNKHNSFNLMYFHNIVSGTPYQYLIDFPEVLDAITTFLSGQDQESLFSQLITDSDRESVSRDLKQLRFSQDEFAYGIPVERYFVEYFRHLLSNGSLSINKSPYDVVVSETGVFVNWLGVCGKVLAALLQDGISGIPRDPDTLARIMIERGLAKGKPVSAKKRAEATFEDGAFYIYHLVGVIDGNGKERFSQDARYLLFLDPAIFFSAHVVPTNLRVKLYESLDEALGRTPSVEVPEEQEAQEQEQEQELSLLPPEEDGPTEAEHVTQAGVVSSQEDTGALDMDADSMLGAIGFSTSDDGAGDPEHPQADAPERYESGEAASVGTGTHTDDIDLGVGGQSALEDGVVQKAGDQYDAAKIDLTELGAAASPIPASLSQDAAPLSEDDPGAQRVSPASSPMTSSEAIFARLTLPEAPADFDPEAALNMELGEPGDYSLERLVEEAASSEADAGGWSSEQSEQAIPEVDLDALMAAASSADQDVPNRQESAEPQFDIPSGLLVDLSENDQAANHSEEAEQQADLERAPATDQPDQQEQSESGHATDFAVPHQEPEDSGPIRLNGVEIEDFSKFFDEETAAGRDPMRVFNTSQMKLTRRSEHFQRKMKQRIKKANRSTTDDYDVRQMLEQKKNGGKELTYEDIQAKKIEGRESAQKLSALGFVVPGVTMPSDNAAPGAEPEPESANGPSAFVVPNFNDAPLQDSEGDGLHEKALLMWPSKDDEQLNVMTQLDVIDKIEGLNQKLYGTDIPDAPDYPGLTEESAPPPKKTSRTSRKKPKPKPKQQPKQQQPKPKPKPKQESAQTAHQQSVIVPSTPAPDVAALRKDFDKALSGFHQALVERCDTARVDLTPAIFLSHAVLAVVKGDAALGTYLYRADGGKKDAALYRLRYPAALEQYAGVGHLGLMMNARDLAWALHSANLVVDHDRSVQGTSQPVALDPDEGGPAIRVARSIGQYVHWLILASERLIEAGLEIEASVLHGLSSGAARPTPKPTPPDLPVHLDQEPEDCVPQAPVEEDVDDFVVTGLDAAEREEIEAIGKDKKKAKQFIFMKIKNEVLSGTKELLPDESPVMDEKGNLRISKRIIGSALRKYPDLRVTRSAMNMYIRSNRNSLKATTDTHSVIFFGDNKDEV